MAKKRDKKHAKTNLKLENYSTSAEADDSKKRKAESGLIESRFTIDSDHMTLEPSQREKQSKLSSEYPVIPEFKISDLGFVPTNLEFGSCEPNKMVLWNDTHVGVGWKDENGWTFPSSKVLCDTTNQRINGCIFSSDDNFIIVVGNFGDQYLKSIKFSNYGSQSMCDLNFCIESKSVATAVVANSDNTFIVSTFSDLGATVELIKHELIGADPHQIGNPEVLVNHNCFECVNAMLKVENSNDLILATTTTRILVWNIQVKSLVVCLDILELFPTLDESQLYQRAQMSCLLSSAVQCEEQISLLCIVQLVGNDTCSFISETSMMAVIGFQKEPGSSFKTLFGYIRKQQNPVNYCSGYATENLVVLGTKEGHMDMFRTMCPSTGSGRFLGTLRSDSMSSIQALAVQKSYKTLASIDNAGIVQIYATGLP